MILLPVNGIITQKLMLFFWYFHFHATSHNLTSAAIYTTTVPYSPSEESGVELVSSVVCGYKKMYAGDGLTLYQYIA